MEYKIGNKLITKCGYRETDLTITEVEAVNEIGTHAVLRFMVTDFTSKKTKHPITGKLQHRKVGGWVDSKGCWYI